MSEAHQRLLIFQSILTLHADAFIVINLTIINAFSSSLEAHQLHEKFCSCTGTGGWITAVIPSSNEVEIGCQASNKNREETNPCSEENRLLCCWAQA